MLILFIYRYWFADFGELLTWWSVYFASLPAIYTHSPTLPAKVAMSLIALISPVFITYLLLKLSGIPLLEKKYKKQYQGNSEYEEYIRNTPLLMPNPFLSYYSKNKMK